MINQNNSVPDELKKINTALTLKDLWDQNMIEERKDLNANGKTVLEGGKLGEIPITVITAGSNGFENWNNTQKSLLTSSKNTKQVYLKNASHFIQYEQPNVVNE